MEEHSESTDDKGRENIIVSYQERKALEIFIVYSEKIIDFVASAFLYLKG